MKRRKRADRRQATLKGWWKALPFLLIPFGAFLTETWLHTQILNNGDRETDLTLEIKGIKENIVQLEADLSFKINVGDIEEQALAAGFVRAPKIPVRLVVTQDFAWKIAEHDQHEEPRSD